jgi:8-oxo-dGTP diphosphatase
MKQIEVVAAVIRLEDKVLAVQRGDGRYAYVSRKFEFPGGKIENGESHHSAVLREIHEELALEVEVEDFLMTVQHNYPDFELTMHCYACRTSQEQPVLHEHLTYRWCLTHELPSLDWAAADLPVVDRLLAQSHER